MIRRWLIGLAMLGVVAYAVVADVGSGLYNRQHIASYVFYRADSTLIDTTQAGAGIAKLWAVPTYYVDTTGHGIAGTYSHGDSHGFWYWANPATDIYDIYSDSSGAATLRADNLLIYGRSLGDSMIADSSNFAPGVVTGAAIKANTISAAQIGPDAITASELADNAVDSAAVANLAIHPGHILMTPTSGYASLEDYNGALAVKLDSLHLAYSASGIALSTGSNPINGNAFLSFDPTAGILNLVWRDMSGDVTNTAGAMAIGADKITEAKLKAVDAAADEDILTFETTTGDFEWHTVNEASLNQSTASPAASMWSACPILAAAIDPSIMAEFDDEFTWYVTAHEWTAKVVNGGGISISGSMGSGGIILIDVSDVGAEDNDESYLYETNAPWLLTANKDLWAEARVQFSENSTDDNNFIFGLVDQATSVTDILLDGGGGPLASYDGVVAFKVDGGTVWQGEVSNGASQSTDTNIGARTGGTWTRVGFHVTSNTSVDFFVNGVNGGTLNSNLPDGYMRLVVGVKQGSTTEDYGYIDKARCKQLR